MKGQKSSLQVKTQITQQLVRLNLGEKFYIQIWLNKIRNAWKYKYIREESSLVGKGIAIKLEGSRIKS